MKNRTFLAASVARIASLISSPGGGGLLCHLRCAGVAIQASAQKPVATFATASSSVNEDGGTVTLTVNLTSAVDEDGEIGVSYAVGSDSDTSSPADYTDPNSGFVSLSTVATSVNITITIEDDGLPEDDETLLVTLEDGGYYDAGSAKTHTIKIIDNDDPAVSFVEVDASFASDAEEDAGFVYVTVQLNNAHQGSDLDIGYTVTGTATFDADADGFAGSGDFGITGLTNVNDAEVMVSSFTQFGYIDVAINDDGTAEEDETVILTLVDGDGYTVVSDSSVFTITIKADDNDEGAVVQKPTITIAGNASTFEEGDRLTFDVSSDEAVTAALDVTLTVSDAAGSDFLDSANEGDQTVTIKVDSTTTRFYLPTRVNDVYDVPGTITVALASGAGYDVGTPASVSADGTDPEGPFVSFASASSTIEEDARQLMGTIYEPVWHDFVVNIDPSSPALVILFSVMKDGTTADAGDYQVDFGPGISVFSNSIDRGVQMFTAQVSAYVPDLFKNVEVDAEEDETVIFEIVDGPGYRPGTQNTHTVTIEDNEVTASFASASTVVEEDAGTVEVTVNLDKEPAAPIQIIYEVTRGEGVDAGDYVLLNVLEQGIITGVTKDVVTIPVEIFDDIKSEPDETLTLTLLGGVKEELEEGEVPYNNHLGDIVEHTITIRASDGHTSTVTAPVASFASASATAAESAGTQNVAINLSPVPSAATTLNYTLSGTATRGADYTISGVTSNNGTVNVNGGDASVNIPVVITDDSADEPNETVILTLASGTGYDVGSTTAYTLTITDNDDAAPPATDTPPATTAASVTLSASPNPVAEGDSVMITVTPSQLLSSDVTVPLLLTAGTAEAEDYSALASIVIEGNEPNGTGVIRARKDVDMDDETFTVSLGTLPSSVVAGTPASVEITIMDVGTVSAEADGQELPDAFALEQNYPNPFNPSTAIEYALPEAAHVVIEVFDATGRSAGVLVDGVRPAGRHSAHFEAGSLPSGLYVYRMHAGGQTMVRKMTLVR